MTQQADFAQGDEDYIAKLNANANDAESRISANETKLTTSGFDLAQAVRAILDRSGVLGDQTVVPSISPADSISIASTTLGTPPGVVMIGGVAVSVADQTVAATGGAGTRYAQIASNGLLSVDAAIDPAKLLVATASWNGVDTLSALVDSRVYLLNGEDYADMLVSTVLGQTFTRVADRLENMEALVGGGVTVKGYSVHDGQVINGVGVGLDTTTGMVVWSYGGTGGVDQIAGWTFQIPEDWSSGGRVRFVLASDGTSTDDVQFLVTTTVHNDAPFDTPDDTDEQLIFNPAGTIDLPEKTAYLTPTVGGPKFGAGVWVTIGLRRLGNAGPDVNDDAMNLWGMEFEYTRG